MSQGTIANPLEILKGNGFKPSSDLNYCTENGIEYFIGWQGNKALIVATARHYGITHITLLTNYGLELHSRYEKPETVGLNKIIKAIA